MPESLPPARLLSLRFFAADQNTARKKSNFRAPETLRYSSINVCRYGLKSANRVVWQINRKNQPACAIDKSTLHMSAPYFFFRPILAVDRSWAAFDWQSAAPFTTDSSELVRCFEELDSVTHGKLLPLVALLNPAAFEQASFFRNFDSRRVIFILPASSLENPSSGCVLTIARS